MEQTLTGVQAAKYLGISAHALAVITYKNPARINHTTHGKNKRKRYRKEDLDDYVSTRYKRQKMKKNDLGLLTKKEAAEYLGISYATLLRIHVREKIKPRFVARGRSHLYSKSDLSLYQKEVKLEGEQKKERTDQNKVLLQGAKTKITEEDNPLWFSGAKSLTNRQRNIIIWAFGLIDGHARTYWEMGKCLGVSKERVRQIYHLAMRRLMWEIMRRNTTLEDIITDPFEETPRWDERTRTLLNCAENRYC